MERGWTGSVCPLLHCPFVVPLHLGYSYINYKLSFLEVVLLHNSILPP